MIIYPVIIPECNGDCPLWYAVAMILVLVIEIVFVIWAVWRIR